MLRWTTSDKGDDGRRRVLRTPRSPSCHTPHYYCSSFPPDKLLETQSADCGVVCPDNSAPVL